MAEMRESNKLGGLTVKVDVDVSDALKGLKALRREANKTVKALEKVLKLKEAVDEQNDEQCPECGGNIVTSTFYRDGEVYLEICECDKCGRPFK